jgi:DinB superfamily
MVGMRNPAKPELAPPGAGLPLPELFIARLLFRLKRLRYDQAASTAEFLAERAGIRELVNRCEAESRGVRVLIRRVRGLEDSSRNWSVWMTLEHLRITNTIFSGVIRMLVDGEVPARRADTANVKPDPTVTEEADDAYEESCESFVRTISECGDLRTVKKYAHPWFGPLDAAGWHALSALHMRIHREQLRRIVAGLHGSVGPTRDVR